MGLYNTSAMVAILDMQISWFSNSTREVHQRVFRKKFAKISWHDAWQLLGKTSDIFGKD